MKIGRTLGNSVSSLALLVVLAHGAAAQNAPAPGNRGTSGDTQLDELSITASKEEEPAIDALGAVSVRTRTDIQTQQAPRIGDVLGGMPGVSTQENPNDPATAINIRGLQDFGRVAVTIDGSRQNFQRSGHNANGAFFLDPAFVRAIDVTRGPVANIYGSGAIGGVVSFRTVEPDDILRPGETVAGELTGTVYGAAQSGQFGTAIGAFRVGNVVSGLLGFSYRGLDTYRDGAGNKIADTGQELKSGIAKLVIEPAEGHKIVLGGHKQEYQFTNGTGTSTAPRRSNDVDTHNVFLRYSFNRPDNPWINFKFNIYDTGTDTRQVRTSGTPAQIGQKRFFRINTQGFDLHNVSRFDFTDGHLAFTYGGDYFRDRVRTSDPAGNGDETTPGGQRTVFGTFVQSHLKWKMVDVIGAVRYDNYELKNLTGTLGSSGDRVSPKITFGITPIRGIQFFVTYAEGYRAPAITETLVDGLHPAPAAFIFIPNPNLKPEVGKTLEAGVNLKFDGLWMENDRFRAKIAVFRNNVTNYIEGVYTDPGNDCGAPIPGACNDAFFTYVNIGQARLQGAELEAVYDARRWFASINASTVRGDDTTANLPLQSVYPAKVVVGGGMRFFEEKLVVGGQVTHVAAQTRLPPSAATLRSKAYTLLDLYASYEFARDTKAFVTLSNVTDVRYRQFRFNDYNPGFTAKFGFSTRFGT